MVLIVYTYFIYPPLNRSLEIMGPKLLLKYKQGVGTCMWRKVYRETEKESMRGASYCGIIPLATIHLSESGILDHNNIANCFVFCLFIFICSFIYLNNGIHSQHMNTCCCYSYNSKL